jgi:diacylglycerol kinase
VNTVSRDKQRGFKRLVKSFTYALDGLKYAFKYEQNLVIHFLATIIVIALGLILHISLTEWIFCIFAIGLVIATELINTSIEAAIDLVTEEYHKLAKIAKDTAAAAVLVFALTAFLIGIIIFVPKVVALI